MDTKSGAGKEGTCDFREEGKNLQLYSAVNSELLYGLGRKADKEHIGAIFLQRIVRQILGEGKPLGEIGGIRTSGIRSVLS